MEPQRTKSRRHLGILVGLAVAGLLAFIVSQAVCLTAWARYGIIVPRCPDGRLHPTLSVQCSGLRRGADGVVLVAATAHFTTGEADDRSQAPLRRFDPSLALVDANGGETPLAPTKGWLESPVHLRSGVVVLPKDTPDGDYTLRVRVRSPLGDATADVPLPLFAPARIHVITDRPLYEPGHTVQFRAVALRATDLGPIDGRPGRWVVKDPSGNVVLEERAPAGAYGVVAGSFPLDAGAPAGEWHVAWTSGGAEDAVGFRVEPFTLPRFRVTGAAGKPFYRAGERPVVRGSVVYSSGAPVRGAQVQVTWSTEGEWPTPTEWQGDDPARALPRKVATDAAGAFELRLPAVPDDLRGRATLRARLAATDESGDRVEGGAAVLLSEDALAVSAVSELADGLVAGFNNRLFLRATTPAGDVLAGATLIVKRAWEANDRGITAVTDEDGVAALQIDPGAPVNVVIPPMPVRTQPRPPPVQRTEAEDLLRGDEPPLGDQLAMSRWNAALAPCTRFVADDPQEVTVALRVSPAGAVTATASNGPPAAGCVERALAGKRLPPGQGKDRLYRVAFTLTSHLPKIDVEVDGEPALPARIKNALETAALDARSCLPARAGQGKLPRVLLLQVRPGGKGLATAFARDPAGDDDGDGGDDGDRVSAKVAGCVEQKINAAARRLATTWKHAGKRMAAVGSDADADDGDDDGAALGFARFSIEPADSDSDEAATATIRPGYELSISARPAGAGTGGGGGKEIGSTRLVLQPGRVPPIRLRATPVLARPGSDVEVAILRGPAFSESLPEKLEMTHLHGTMEAKVDKKTRAARFKLPGDARGWFLVAWNEGRALVYVRPAAELTVSIEPGARRYAPGKMAELQIRTRAGNAGTRAAVGLVGVDATLGQLAPLPGPDDLARLRPKPTMRAQAFGALDVAALEVGRIRGAQAATATILQVAALPPPTALEASIDAAVAPAFEPLEALTDNFYNALGQLHAEVRAWEASAPKDVLMSPATMATLWSSALAACEKRKIPVEDAYGRRLLLRRLPADLLALTDPRAVVIDGTRLPEDVESWPAWVAKERP